MIKIFVIIDIFSPNLYDTQIILWAVPFDRNFINHDHEATMYSQLINSNFRNMSLSLAIDEIVSNF